MILFMHDPGYRQLRPQRVRGKPVGLIPLLSCQTADGICMVVLTNGIRLPARAELTFPG